MGKKKRSHPDVEELLARPWCYYCERDFEDLKLLISHQKAKHFKCDRCGRRLNTAGGLSVHMNQVHKESLSSVENALANRQGLEVEIFGMEGIPEDIVQQHNQRIIQGFYQAQADRRAATGNPPPGEPGEQGPTKKLKVESADELKKRLAEFRAQKASLKTNGSSGNTPRDTQSPGQSASPGAFTSPFGPPQSNFEYPQQFAAPGAPGAAAYASHFPPGAAPPPGSNLPARPPGTLAAAAPPGLPQRPPYAGNYPPGSYPPPGAASTLDELVASASRQGDDIDHIIRMAEAGIKPAGGKDGSGTPVEPPSATAAPTEKGKKDKSMRMVYADAEFSLEEKMAQMPRYAVVPSA